MTDLLKAVAIRISEELSEEELIYFGNKVKQEIRELRQKRAHRAVKRVEAKAVGRRRRK